MEKVRDIYERRFSPGDREAMDRVWQELAGGFFQKFVRPEGTILDIGGGYCGFINHIRAARRIVMDPNPVTGQYAAPGVEILASADLTLNAFRDGELTHVFMSNFLEHLSDADAVLRLFAAVRRVLADDGTVLILQPNFRYTGAAYFDFIDHRVVLTDRSLVEALEVNGFRIETLIRRFLPYTSKSALPRSPAAVRAYLRCPPLWRIFGQQTFVAARKS